MIRPAFEKHYPTKEISNSNIKIKLDMKMKEAKFDVVYDNVYSFLILSAPPRSGKSTWIQNCLCKNGKVYNKKFDPLLVIVYNMLQLALRLTKHIVFCYSVEPFVDS
eukprot:SAG22_NODE_1038_length_5890_cov_5.432050_1_plen_106_part_10